ncbi:MAG TPA: endonuclease MutS2 [Symbiobacteriaceae bacterium]|nr:endonuclease MutS2 [Symbiobacteriaceae bacterium]
MDERTLRTLEFAKIREKLAERAATVLGKEICEDLAPSTEFLEVKHRQDETSEARRLYMAGGSIPLGGIHDLRAAVQRAIRGGILDPHDLLDLADTASAGRRLRKYLQENAEQAPILAAISNMIGAFSTLESEIRRSITEHGEVSDHASPALAEIRRAQRTIQGRIKDRMDSYVRGPGSKYLQESIVTIRDDRYVIPVKIEYRAQVPGIVHDQSGSGSTLFIEPMAVVEMNNELKELTLKERDEINRILSRISGLVANEADSLSNSLQAFAQIDFASAKGKLSMDLDCVGPELERKPMLEIRKGRHPLLKGAVVPVDINIGINFDTLVITGPNTGGKTVSLKTMGLFVLMAQSGLHLPAGFGTRVGMFEQVFVDVGDEQSIEQSLSTFSSHMTNIVRIIENIEGPALVLVDELGAGTDPNEGAALAMSILEHLAARGAKTVATTHYSELKTYAYTRSRVENASVEFNVETLRPTYRLLIGVPGSSNAFEISRRLGLPGVIVERARDFLTRDQEKVEDLIAGIHATRAELEKERTEAAKLRYEAQQMKAEYERKFAGASEKAHDVVEKARVQAANVLAQARREAEAVIEELKAAVKQQREAERNQAIQGARQRLSNARAGLEESRPTRKRAQGAEPPRGLKPGDAVLILPMDQIGYVITPPDTQGNVQVQAGILKVNLPLTDLERAEDPNAAKAAAPKPAAAGRAGRGASMAKAQEIATEIDLRGLMVEEALDKVDKYLDDAVLGGAPFVRIIHGKGTGALRKAVTDFLKSDSRVTSFRLGGMGEGGDGVTVARLGE